MLILNTNIMKHCYLILFVSLIFNISAFTNLSAKEKPFSEQAKEYRKIGYLALVEGNLEKAYQFLKKSVYLDSGSAVVHNDLAIVYERRGLRELALKEYLEAISLDPKYPPPYMNLALFYREVGDKEKAIYYLRERVKLGRKNDPWRKKAQVLLRQYELASAETAAGVKKEFKESSLRELEDTNLLMEEVEKERIERLYTEGREALEKGDFSLAIEKAIQLLSLDPMYKNAEEILVSAEREKFIQETKPKDEPIIVPIP